MNSFETGGPKWGSDELRVLAALKSERSITGEGENADAAYFLDNQKLLLNPEIMRIVATIYPYSIGYLDQLNTDQDFVNRWFGYIKDPELKRKVYTDARQNTLRLYVEGIL